MAIKSMTGFGRGEASGGGLKVEVELSTVNRRQFDMRLNMPRALTALESRVHAMIHKAIARGNVTGAVRVGAAAGVGGGALVDTDLAAAYLKDLRKAARALDLRDDLTARSLTTLPGVARFGAATEDTERVWPLLERALKAALRQLVGMRRAEGKALQQDLLKRLEKLRVPFEKIRKAAPAVAARLVKGVQKRVKRAGFELAEDAPSLQREIVMYADRSDISEELVRLESHFDQARRLLTGTVPAGRALDFVCQEMLREINTIGSKANDANLSKQVIAFKTLLECVREQVQNVE